MPAADCGALPCDPGQGCAYGGHSITCTACEANQHSPRGLACGLCPAGRAPDKARVVCLACAPGTAGTNGRCEACAAGRVGAKKPTSEGEGAEQCQACPRGSFAGATGSTICTACDAGSVAESGATKCTKCARGRFAPRMGSTGCTACPHGMTTLGLRRTACVCKSGFYDVQSRGVVSCFDDEFDDFTAKVAQTRANAAVNSTESLCIPCETSSCITCSIRDSPGKPEFVIKDGWGLTVTGQHDVNVSSLAQHDASVSSLGRYRSGSVRGAHNPAKTLFIFKCPRSGACPAKNDTEDKRCANHARGILCGECDVGYRGSPTKPCSKCKSTWAGVVAKFVGIVIACATTLWIMRRRALGARLLKLLERKKKVSSHSLHARSQRLTSRALAEVVSRLLQSSKH